MDYGHFASVVQLGVGVHIGTALLRTAADFGLTEATRKVEQIQDNLPQLRNDIEFSPHLEYKIHTLKDASKKIKDQFELDLKLLSFVNLFWALVLFVQLIIISFQTNSIIDFFSAFLLCFISFAPSLFTVIALWISTTRSVEALDRMRERVDSEIFNAPRKPS